MKKTIIHTETISKAYEKFPFQLNIPRNAKSLEGIYVSTDITQQTTTPFLQGGLVGDLTFSIPNKKEHFFCISPRLSTQFTTSVEQLQSFGFMSRALWWVNGTRAEFFGIGVDGSETLIEGFYQSLVSHSYQLTIYFQFNV